MTKQLRLMDPQSTAKRPSPSRAYGQLDEHTREVGLLGIRQARAALAEANRRVALREEERLERRDNELADRARSARRARLTLTPTAGPEDGGRVEATSSDSPTPPTSGSDRHRSAA